MGISNPFGTPKGVKILPSANTPKMRQTHCPICCCELRDHEFAVVKSRYVQRRCKHCNVEWEQASLVGDVEINGATYDIRQKCPCLNDHDLMRAPIDPYGLFDAAPNRLFKEFVQLELDVDADGQYIRRAADRELERLACECAGHVITGSDFERDKALRGAFPVYDPGPIVRDKHHMKKHKVRLLSKKWLSHEMLHVVVAYEKFGAPFDFLTVRALACSWNLLCVNRARGLVLLEKYIYFPKGIPSPCVTPSPNVSSAPAARITSSANPQPEPSTATSRSSDHPACCGSLAAERPTTSMTAWGNGST